MWRELNWQTSGKKTSEMAHLSGRFCFHIRKNMVQNNNNVIQNQYLQVVFFYQDFRDFDDGFYWKILRK